MRDFKGMKRQRGRNRNGGGGGGAGGKPQHNTNRAFDSNGPEGVKVRGAAQHVYEKYQQLARDAQTSGDRVLAENHLQHAEHYFRLMRAMQPQRPLSEIIGRDQFVSGYDIDFEDESGGNEASESDGETQDRGEPASDRNDFRPAESRQNDRPRDDRNRNDRPGRNGRDEGAGGRPRYGRDERPYSEPRFEREGQNRDAGVRDAMNLVEPDATPLTATQQPDATSMLRADDGEMSQAPAFLQVRPAGSRDDPDADTRRPRRRRNAPSLDESPVNVPVADADES